MSTSRGVLAVLGVGLISCGGKKVHGDPTPFIVSDIIQPVPNLYLRTSFDKDPSMYLGRFIDEGSAAIDETSARQTQCSKFIKHKVIEGSGKVDQVFTASSNAAASVGIPVIGRAEVGGAGETFVRGSYEFTRKMVAYIPDDALAAFESCCFSGDNMCTDRFVGEFVGGTGFIYQAIGREAEVNLDVMTKQGIVGDLEASRGVMWRRSAQFDDAFFAVKTTQAPVDVVIEPCGAWTNGEVPRSPFGMYFVGTGNPNPNEREARNSAMLDVYAQIIKYAGVEVNDLRMTFEGDQGTSGSAQSGSARRVEKRAECKQELEDPNGLRYKTKVLGFISNDNIERVREIDGSGVLPTEEAGPD